MKLNNDCVRALLLSVEEEISFGEFLDLERLNQLPRLVSYDVEDVMYTITKVWEAGFIKADVLGGLGEETDAVVSSLTYDGHKFLDTIRDDGIWADTKKAASKFAGASLPIMAEIATSILKKKVGLE